MLPVNLHLLQYQRWRGGGSHDQHTHFWDCQGVSELFASTGFLSHAFQSLHNYDKNAHIIIQ